MTALTPLFSYLFVALMPHGYCYLWKTPLVGLHLVSDGLITVAYYSIPLTLVYFVRKRHNFPYNWVFLLFGAFIVSCGTTHLMAIWTLWHPDYWLSGIIKAITAFISIYTAIVLIPLLPQFLALPSIETLEEEIKQRQTIEKALRRSQRRLESILDMAEEAIISLNAKQEITLFNRGAEKIFGWNASEMIGKSLDCLIPDRFVTSHQQYVKQFQQSSDVTRKMEKRREIFGLRKDKTEFLAEASIAKLDVSEETIVTVFLRDISDRRQREQATYEHQQRFRKVFEEGPLGMAIVGLDYRFIDVNHTLCQLLGYSAPELLELTFVDVTHPEDIDKDITLAQQLYQQEIPYYSLEKRYVTKEGNVLWIMLTAALLKDEQGQPRYGFAMIEDISERKAIQQTLELQDVIVKNMAEGVCLVSADTGELVYVNPKFERMFGYEMGELKGQHVSVINYHDQDNNTKKVYQEIRQNVLEKGEYTYEVYNMKKDGTAFWCRATSSCFNHPEYGKVLVAVQEDIDENKKIEAALKNSEQRLQYLIRSSPVVIFGCQPYDDFPATYISENVTNLLGYKPEDFLEDSKFWVDRVHPEDRDRVLSNLSQLFEQDFYNHEYRFLHADGHYCWLLAQLRLMRDETGQPRESLGYLVDISDRRKTENQLTTSLDEKEVLLREIHHRVKNNLQVICSLLNLQVHSAEDIKIKDLLRESQNRVRSMSLVHEKLYCSHNIASINLGDYLNDLVKNIMNSYKNSASRIILKTEIDPLILLNIDTAVPCGLILNELISNAYKYAFKSEEQGEILIKAKTNNQQELILIVKDNGQGLPKNFDLEKVKTLGLQLVKSLTHQLRGQLIMESKQGTQIQITLTRLG